jgi:hypothetical protein
MKRYSDAARGTCVRFERDDLAGVWVHFRARWRVQVLPGYRLIEFLAVSAVVLTAHVGGFLSGVNGPR